MSTTLREVAHECGVSIQTVSRILNGGQRQRYRSDTCDRVMHAARRLGYRPSAVAQAMRANRMASVGLFSCVEDAWGHFTGRLWSGIQGVLDRRGYNLITGFIPLEQPPADGKLPAIIQQRLVEGLLVNFTHQIPRWIEELVAGQRGPAVWINVKRADPCVYLADEDAGYALTRAFLERGHTRVAYLDYVSGAANASSWHYSAVDRAAGYQRAMQEAGLPERIIRGETPVPDAAAVGYSRAWLSGAGRPTAVICYSLDHGLRSVTYAATMLRQPWPALGVFAPEPVIEAGVAVATAVVNQTGLGERATDMLLDWIESSQAPLDAEAGRVALPLSNLDAIPPPTDLTQ